MLLSVVQLDSLSPAGRLEILPDGWLRTPGAADGADLVHGSGMAIFDMETTCILIGPEFGVELASVGDALAAASALMGSV